MDGRRNNSGKKGNKGGGRKPLLLEYNVRRLTAPHVEDAFRTIVEIMHNGEKQSDRLFAAKLILAYYFGHPKNSTDINDAKMLNLVIKTQTIEDAEIVESIIAKPTDD